MVKQTERAASMRATLVEAAGRLYVEKGHEAVSTNEIIEAAGVSRGAMYHHFATKRDLFSAVFERVADGLVRRAVAKVDPAASPVERVIQGSMAWVEEVCREPLAPIVLTEGPMVLGWEAWREVDERYTLGITKRALQAAVDAGDIAVPSLELAALIVGSATGEIAMAALKAQDRDAALAAGEATLRGLLNGFAVR